MGFLDNFTSDGFVEVKHGEYYSLMKEAVKAELVMNAVKTGVPSEFIEAMVTGKKCSVDEVKMAEAETIDSLMQMAPDLDCCMWGRFAAAAKDIFNDNQDSGGVWEMYEAMRGLLESLASARLKEIVLRTRAENTEPLPKLKDMLCDGCSDRSNDEESEGTDNG